MAEEDQGWPIGENGRPMAKVTSSANEKIGMPNYSNVTLGPFYVTRFVEDDPEAIKEGLREGVLACEEVIGEERGAVVEVVKAALQTAYAKG